MPMTFNRRSMFRAALGMGTVTVGLPLLDCFLNENGNAFADDGAPIPVRFGTYFWGLGFTKYKGLWEAEKSGPLQLMTQTESLKGVEKKVSLFAGFNVLMDGKPNIQHHSGHAGILSGAAPSIAQVFDYPSFDTAVADEIGGGTRFRNLDITPFGSPRLSYSTRTGRAFSTPEISPISLYTRIFGEGFQDPNSATWTPSREAMLKRSVLSSVTAQRQALMSELGANDKQRIDQYFTSLRQMEEQLQIELTKPAKCESCVVPTRPEETARSEEIGVVTRNNKLMADLMAVALACNQTKVFNVVHTGAFAGTYLPGDANAYHLHTHDEPDDPQVGYQKTSAKLAAMSFQGYADFLKSLDAIKEGPGTLLDNCLVFGYSDTGNARLHSNDGIPMVFGGLAGGRHKAGQFIRGDGDPVTRVTLTAQQLAGLPLGEYGKGAMRTTKSITETQIFKAA